MAPGPVDRVTSVLRSPLALAVVTAIALSAVAAMVQAPYATGDEAPHIDYAYRVWQGELPVFEDGLEHRPAGAWLAPVQWTAQHPPLFYAMVAPIVGPLAEAGHHVAAVYAARAVNVLLSGVLVLVAHASARVICRQRSLVPTSLAFVVAMMAAKSLVGGSGYNDLLAAVFATAAFGVAGATIRRGLDARTALALSLLASAAALTRLSAGIVVAVIAAVAALVGLIRAVQGRGRWGPLIGLALGGPALVLAAAGWFYLRNIELTGNLTGSNFAWSVQYQGRVPKPLWLVMVEPITWLRLPNLFWWAGQQPPRTTYVMTTMVLTGLALVWAPLVIAAIGRVRSQGDLGDWADPTAADRWASGVLLVAPVTVVVATQLVFASNGGGVYPRYLLPVSLPISLAIAAGLCARPRLLIPAWTAITLADLVGWVVAELRTPPAHAWYYTESAALSVVVAGVAVLAGIVAARAVLETTANHAQAATAARAAATASVPTAAS